MHSRLNNANFTFLLVGLLSVLLINPFTEDLFGYTSEWLTSLTFSSVMMIGIWSLHESKALFRFGIVLIGISLSVGGLEQLYPDERILRIIDLCVVIIFCMMSFVFILADITSDLKVDRNRVVGAICLYLLIGLIFGLLYTIIEILLPGSFTNMPAEEGRASERLFYYSYVTLTTLGYGDITPLRPIARTFSYLEAIIGVFYMSIMIGAMISLLLNRANAEIVDRDEVEKETK